MDENTYSLIFLLLFVVLLVTGSRRDASTTFGEGSELNACDRYAIADKCLEEFARYWK